MCTVAFAGRASRSPHALHGDPSCLSLIVQWYGCYSTWLSYSTPALMEVSMPQAASTSMTIFHCNKLPRNLTS